MKRNIPDESSLRVSAENRIPVTLQVSRKPIKCPVCCSRKIASYFYGMPILTEDLQRKLDEGKIVLGGCCIVSINPKWACLDCQTDFYKNMDY